MLETVNFTTLFLFELFNATEKQKIRSGEERTDSVSANNSFEKRSEYVILELSTA